MLSEERPYEKCERFGAGSLTDIELLAVLLRTGTKGESALDLARKLFYPGEGTQPQAKAHLQSWTREDLDFSRPDTIAAYYMEDMRYYRQEHLKLLMLNTRSRLIGESEISRGTVNMSVISPRELFIEALQKNAVYIILLHNHPSGDPMPSREDILVTQRIREGGSLLGIELLDHIIIGDNCYVSLAEQKLLKEK